MENKLAKYRAKKEREAKLNVYKSKINTIYDKIIMKIFPPKEKLKEETSVTIEKETEAEEPTETDLDDETLFSCTKLDLLIYFLWFSLWAAIYQVFINYGFGTVYFILSLLIGMYLNTRTNKKKDEVSAYSVFNKDCKSIDGTLDGEQLVKSMVYGPAALLK